MSVNLYANGKCVSWRLKFAIAPILWEHDGSLSGEDVFVDEDHEVFPIIERISKKKDEEGRDALKVLKLIQKHKGIFLSLRH